MTRRAKALVFADPLSRKLLERIERLALSDAPVLVTGETGTGKELVARKLHTQSRRSTKPFLAINAGAFPEHLIESELFGHEKGAFTGAFVARPGWFEAADGGTLFLDEVGDLPLSLQVKLLRVLQEGEVTRVGARRPIRIDVRLIAATNVDLSAAMRAKHFREDLYFRLNVSSLRLPPLRERPGDILPLAEHFLRVYEQRFGKRDVSLATNAAARLLGHAWPGNIRELENAVHHALMIGDGSTIEAEHLELLALGSSPRGRDADEEPPLARLERTLLELLDTNVPNLHELVDRALFRAAYAQSGQNQLEMARRLGVSRNVVRARLIEHGELKGPLRRSRPDPGRPFLIGAGAKSLPVRIGYQKLGIVTLVKGMGSFDRELVAQGSSGAWIEYPGGMQIVDDLQSGRLDIGVIGDCPAVLAQAKEVPIVYFAAEPPAPRGAAVLVPADSKVRTIADLRGKTVAVNRAAQAHYLLLKALDEANLDVADVEIRFMAPDQALKAFLSGKIQGWSIWDPWLSSARLEHGARVVRDATGLFKNSVCYVARRDFVAAQPAVVQTLLDELLTAAQAATEDPCRAARVMAPELGLSTRALEASLAREYGTLSVGDDLVAAQQDIADTLHRFQLISRPISVVDALWRLPLAG